MLRNPVHRIIVKLPPYRLRFLRVVPQIGPLAVIAGGEFLEEGGHFEGVNFGLRRDDEDRMMTILNFFFFF
jgi:hypothetical protein